MASSQGSPLPQPGELMLGKERKHPREKNTIMVDNDSEGAYIISLQRKRGRVVRLIFLSESKRCLTEVKPSGKEVWITAACGCRIAAKFDFAQPGAEYNLAAGCVERGEKCAPMRDAWWVSENTKFSVRVFVHPWLNIHGRWQELVTNMEWTMYRKVMVESSTVHKPVEAVLGIDPDEYEVTPGTMSDEQADEQAAVWQ